MVLLDTVARVLACAAVAASLLFAPAAHTQAAQPDSATIYLARAQALDTNPMGQTESVALPLWQRAAELYASRGDSLNEATALTGALWSMSVYGWDGSAYRTKILPMMQRAVSVFTAVGATAKAASAIEAAHFAINEPRGTADSTLAYRRVLLRMRREIGDRAGEARVLSRLTFSLMSDDDSALFYGRRSVEVARATPDTAAQLSALNALGNAFKISSQRSTLGTPELRKARNDSAFMTFREGVRIARLAKYYGEEYTDLSNMEGMFQRLIPSDPRNLDSVFKMASDKLTASRRFEDRGLEAVALVRMSSLHWTYRTADSARIYAIQALPLARSQPNKEQLKTVLLQLASNEMKVGWPDSALMRYREILPIAVYNGNYTYRLTTVWRLLAEAHSLRNNRDSALMYYRRVMADTVSPDESIPLRAVGLRAIANEFLLLQQPDSATKYFALLTDFSRTQPGDLYANVAATGIARAQLARGNVDSAALLLRDKVRVSKGMERADALSWLSFVESRTGALDSALIHTRAALAGYRAFRDRVGESNELSNLAGTHREMGLMDSALFYYRLSLQLREGDHDREGVRNATSLIARVFLDADNADSSFIYNRRALDIASVMDNPIPRSALYNGIGLTYLNIGQFDSAAVYFNRFLSISRERKNLYNEAAALTNLAFVRMKSSADDSVFALLRKSIALRVEVQDRAGEAAPRMYLARAFGATGRADSALIYAREAVTLSRAVRNRQYEGRALAEVGRAFAQLGMIDSARANFSQALTVMRAIGFARGVRTTLAEMAELFRSGSGNTNLSLATAYFDSAAAVVDDARRGAGVEENAVALSEDQVDVFGGWARAWVGRAAEVGASRSASSALGAVERGRAQSLVDMLTLLQSANRAQQLVNYRPRIGGDLSVEVDSLLASLRASHSAALSYLHTGDTLFTWFLAPSGALELQKPVRISEADLNQLVRASRRALGANDSRSGALDPGELNIAADSVLPSRKDDDDWKRLTELLLPADLTSKVPAGTPIVIVPHGAIGLVPFSALATRADSAEAARKRSAGGRGTLADTTGLALGLRNPIRYAPSFAALRATEQRARVAVAQAPPRPAPAREWSATRAPGAPPRPTPPTVQPVLSQALVVGNPTMPLVYSGRWTNRAQLRPLPGAEAESRTIALMLGARVLTGKAATETAIRERMSAAPLIHFATHGLAYGTSSAARHSYVAFAPDAKQDGFLTLGELMDDQSITLRAELVVLSACQTGLGNMKKAEGSIGLQRAFLAKGARSVLVSLWNVDDRATRLLMEKFYGYWLSPTNPRSKATALQLAQRDVRRTKGFEHPKFWAAFQLVGAQ